MLGRLFSVILFITMMGVLSPVGAAAAGDQLSFYKRFPVAASTGYENTPDIASCPGSDAYLVVYDKDGQVFGQRLDDKGDLIQDPFEISSLLEGEARIPQVDCIPGDPSYFVVTWLLYSVIHQWDIQIQAVHGTPQSGYGAQLFGVSQTIAGGVWGTTSPQIACSVINRKCLLTYTYDGPEVLILARRLEMIETGIAFLGDEFDFPLTGSWQQFNTLSYNSLDDNYLVLWPESYWISNKNFQIGFTHVFADEQGPGMNELQHPPDWLFVTSDPYRSCDLPRAAFNQQSGKFLVVFQCSNAEYYDALEIYVQRVDGVGPGKQGEPVKYLNLGDLQTADSVSYDVWISKKPTDENRFMIGMATDTFTDSPHGKLYLFAIKGSYDPASPDQLDSGLSGLGEAESYSPSGIGIQSTGRSILVTGDGEWDQPSDIYGYLFAPYVNRFTVIFNGSE